MTEKNVAIENRFENIRLESSSNVAAYKLFRKLVEKMFTLSEITDVGRSRSHVVGVGIGVDFIFSGRSQMRNR